MSAIVPRPEVFRQSLLRGSTICARRTKFGLMLGDDMAAGWVGSSGDLGTAWHEYMRAYLMTLAATGNEQASTQEAVEIMYETLGRIGFALPWEDLDALRGMVLRFCEHKWDPRLLASAEFEQDLMADIVCPDGVVRTAKGTPDVLMFDPPDSLLIIDAKSGRGKPKSPRVNPPAAGEVLDDRRYLADMFQGDTYSALALLRYRSAERVKFREFHLRSGMIRQGTLTREQLEHVERKLGLLMMRLDDAISAGPDDGFWAPRPGSHCLRACPVARSCTIPEEMRGLGAVGSQETADRLATAYPVLKTQYTQAGAQLKAWEEEGNPPGRVNDGEVVRWDPPGSWAVRGGGRKHGLHPVVDAVNDSEGSK